MEPGNDLTIISELLPPAQILAVLLMGEVQMIRRLTECIFVNSYSASTMSVVIYLTGVFFYCFQGISIVCLMQEKTLTLSKYICIWITSSTYKSIKRWIQEKPKYLGNRYLFTLCVWVIELSWMGIVFLKMYLLLTHKLFLC